MIGVERGMPSSRTAVKSASVVKNFGDHDGICHRQSVTHREMMRDPLADARK